MATMIRTDYPGAIHHVFARGNGKREIFLDKADNAAFLNRLAELKSELDFRLYAYCLMGNHYHLLIETGKATLAALMCRLQTSYAMRFKKKYGSIGHVFQGRYGAKLCSRDAYFLRLLRYIHRNPIAAGFARAASDWEWSGHRELLEGRSGLIDQTLPLSFFAGDLAERRAAYADFISCPVDDGSPEFDEPCTRPLPSEGLTELATQVATEYDVALTVLMSGSRARGLTPVKLALLDRATEAGYTSAAVARFLRCTTGAMALLSRRNK